MRKILRQIRQVKAYLRSTVRADLPGKEEIDHLETISTALDIALKEEDLVEIKEELTQSGYIRRKGGTKKAKTTSMPFHYLSSDGFHIYVGKIISRMTN